MDESIELGDWVRIRHEGDHTILMGPGRQLLRVATRALHAPSARTRALLRERGFTSIPAPAAAARASRAIARPDARAGWIVAGSWVDDAHQLAGALREVEDARDWRVVATPSDVPHSPDGLAFCLLAHEPVQLPGWMAALAERCPLVWSGDSHEGLYVGPVLRTRADLEDLDRARLGWASTEEIFARTGMRERWAHSLLRELRLDPIRVARALTTTANDTSRVTLLDGARKRLWVDLGKTAIDSADRDELRWHLGIAARMSAVPDPRIDGVYYASCLTPCGGKSYYEGNYGKGSSVAAAELSAFGEAIERFSAWQANHLPAEQPPPGARCYPPEAFHPAGADWDAYRRAGSEVSAWIAARDIAFERTAWVAHSMVPFPTPPHQPPQATSDTGGLAVYPTREGAILRGALEILERDALYPAIRQLEPGIRLDVDALPSGRDAGRQLSSLRRAMARNGLHSWLVALPHPLSLPIVHAFVHDEDTRAMGRGTGSALTWAEAAHKALLEAGQIRRDRQQLESPTLQEGEEGHQAWARPEVVRVLRHWLDGMPTGTPGGREFDSEAEMLSILTRDARETDTAILVVDLPCPIRDWHAVRVMIPGAALCEHASDSAGGRKLAGAAFTAPIPH